MANTHCTIQCKLPTYQKDRSKWRKDILANVMEASRGIKYDKEEQLEVVVLLYLSLGKRLDIHDVDNRLKDILDALQGRFKRTRERTKEKFLIENDNQVYRVLIEKQKIPKRFGDGAKDAGGKLLIRPYTVHRWPLQSTEANRKLEKNKIST